MRPGAHGQVSTRSHTRASRCPEVPGSQTPARRQVRAQKQIGSTHRHPKLQRLRDRPPRSHGLVCRRADIPRRQAHPRHFLRQKRSSASPIHPSVQLITHPSIPSPTHLSLSSPPRPPRSFPAGLLCARKKRSQTFRDSASDPGNPAPWLCRPGPSGSPASSASYPP